MSIFSWNERKSARIAELDKLARIAELEEQNRELQKIRESLLHEVGRIQGEFMVMRDVVDEYREGSERHRNIAERLEKERDDLKTQLETRTKQFVSMKNYKANLEYVIAEAYEAVQKRDSIVTGLDEIDELDPK